jgi:hypothetical protein
MTHTVTFAYSNHRPETLPYAESAMRRNDAVILEEPPTTSFRAMLDRTLAISEYLEQIDFEYPTFARRSCALFRRLSDRGISIHQCDPYLERLDEIHRLFDEGGSPRDAVADPHLGPVYAAEREWTAALVAFYGNALAAPFQDVVLSVTAFARSDAARGRLRDALRARAILEIIPEPDSVYIEAGTLHLALLLEFLKLRPADVRVRVRHLMQPVVRELGGRCRGLGPGDRLTLMLIARPDFHGPAADLLAARSLIYNRIVRHDEMVPGDDPHPHTRDEIEAGRMVEQLGYEECRNLYRQVKAMPRRQARSLVQSCVEG